MKHVRTHIALLLVVLLFAGCISNAFAVQTEPLFAQDFAKNADLSSWAGSAGWAVADGKLTHAGNCNSIITTGSSDWMDYTYRAGIQYTQSLVSPALLFRVQDDNNFYMFLYTPTEQLLRLYKRQNGSFTVLKDVKHPLSANQQYLFQVSVNGSRITCSVDGETLLEHADTTFDHGKIGFRLYSTDAAATALFEAPSVLPLSTAEDENELFRETFDTLDKEVRWNSGQGGDFFLKDIDGDTYLASRSDGILAAGSADWDNYLLSATARITGSGRWNAPGLLFRYQDSNNFYMFMYSYMDNLLRLYRRVNGAFEVLAEKSCHIDKDVDFTYQVHCFGDTLTCYLNGTTVFQYHDSLFAKGRIGFRSYVNNQPNSYSLLDDILVTRVTEAAQIIDPMPNGAFFYDTFQRDLSKWTPASGSYTLGEQGAMPAQSGTSVLLTGQDDWGQYRAQADLTAATGTLGLYTHYTDEQTNYLAAIDFAAQTARLYRGEALLAEKTWRFGPQVQLAVTVNSSRICVWTDGSMLIDYTDEAALAGGKIGLFAQDSDGCFQNAGAYSIGIADMLPGDYPYPMTPDMLESAPLPSEAAFFVAIDGSDDWSGTLDQPNSSSTDGPFATLQRAAQAVAQAQQFSPDRDYIIMVRGGTYMLDQTLELTHGGQDGHRVVWAAYPNETPVISGGKQVTTEWSAYENGIWQTTLGAEFDDADIRQLFVSDTRATRSREPDGEVWNIKSLNVAEKWLTVDADIPESWSGLTGVELNSRGVWHYNRQRVATINAAADTITTNLYLGVQASGVKLRPKNHPDTWAGQDWVIFENALEFVDTPGEWYYDRQTKTLYYYPLENADPNTQKIVIPVLEHLVELSGTKEQPLKNLDILGFCFAHTTWNMPEDIERRGIQGGFWGNERNDPVYAPPAALTYTYAQTCRVQDCSFRLMGEGAVAMGAGANSNLIVGCDFEDVGANCVQIGWRETYLGIGHPLEREWDDDTDAPRGNQILRNTFENCCTVDQGSVAIWVGYANHTLIEHNTILRMPYSGMNIGWRWNAGMTSSHHNTTQWNYVDTVMMTVADGGGIYSVGEQYGNRVLHNYVNNSDGTGIYFDECTNWTEAAFNYTANIRLAGLNCNNNLYNNYYHDHFDSAPEYPEQFGCLTRTGVSGDCYAVNLSVSPANAAVTIYAGEQICEHSVYSPNAYHLPNGVYRYSVSAEGYGAQTDTFTVDGAPVDLILLLQETQPSEPKTPVEPEVFVYPVTSIQKPAQMAPFADIQSSDWFCGAVTDAWAHGLIDGVSRACFDPQGSLTVAQAIKLSLHCIK